MAYTATDARKPFSNSSANSVEGQKLGLKRTGDRVWYPVKVHHNGHDLSTETETLSLSVYEPIAMQILLGGSPPIFGRS